MKRKQKIPTKAGLRRRAEQRPTLRLLSSPRSNEPMDLGDPVVLQSCHRATKGSINSYLVTLAAWVRGLTVTFHYEASGRIGLGSGQGAGVRLSGGLFSLSDGSTTHHFTHTLGDLTPPDVAQRLKDKFATKKRLNEAGVACPQGIIFDRDQIALARKFVQRRGLSRFVVKPVDGSLSQGVHVDLDAEAALACIEGHDAKRLLLETFMPGDEYRVAVVGQRVVAAFRKVPAQVVGDGKQSIAALVAQKNKQRKKNPHLADKPIVVDDAVKRMLAEQGLDETSVPESGQLVILQAMASVVRGGENHEATDRLTEAQREQVEAAARVLEVPNCGMDVIIDPASGALSILEVNARAHISGHAFVLDEAGAPARWSNRVAEAIVDYYFPQTVDQPRQNRAVFDFEKVVQALRQGVVQQLQLPVICSDWVHKRLSVRTSQAERAQQVQRLCLNDGGYCFILPVADGMVVDLLGPPAVVDRVITSLQQAAAGKTATGAPGQ